MTLTPLPTPRMKGLLSQSPSRCLSLLSYPNTVAWPTVTLAQALTLLQARGGYYLRALHAICPLSPISQVLFMLFVPYCYLPDLSLFVPIPYLMSSIGSATFTFTYTLSPLQGLAFCCLKSLTLLYLDPNVIARLCHSRTHSTYPAPRREKGRVEQGVLCRQVEAKSRQV